MYKIISFSFYLVLVYVFVSLIVLYGVAMGFVSSDSQDMLSQSIRFIINHLIN